MLLLHSFDAHSHLHVSYFKDYKLEVKEMVTVTMLLYAIHSEVGYPKDPDAPKYAMISHEYNT